MTNNENTANDQRINALAAFLDVTTDELETQNYDHGYINVAEIEYGEQSYLVLTNEEADTAAREYIENSLWAFSPSFLSEQTNLPEVVFKSLSGLYEDANEAVTALVEQCGDMDTLVSDAIDEDSRGHFLSQWDGIENSDEHEGVTYYIYRTN